MALPPSTVNRTGFLGCPYRSFIDRVGRHDETHRGAARHEPSELDRLRDVLVETTTVERVARISERDRHVTALEGGVSVVAVSAIRQGSNPEPLGQPRFTSPALPDLLVVTTVIVGPEGVRGPRHHRTPLACAAACSSG